MGIARWLVNWSDGLCKTVWNKLNIKCRHSWQIFEEKVIAHVSYADGRHIGRVIALTGLKSLVESYWPCFICLYFLRWKKLLLLSWGYVWKELLPLCNSKCNMGYGPFIGWVGVPVTYSDWSIRPSLPLLLSNDDVWNFVPVNDCTCTPSESTYRFLLSGVYEIEWHALELHMHYFPFLLFRWISAPTLGWKVLF